MSIGHPPATIGGGTAFALYCAWWLARDVVGVWARREKADSDRRDPEPPFHDPDEPSDKGAFARLESKRFGGVEIGAGVTPMRPKWHRQLFIEALDFDVSYWRLFLR